MLHTGAEQFSSPQRNSDRSEPDRELAENEHRRGVSAVRHDEPRCDCRVPVCIETLQKKNGRGIFLCTLLEVVHVQVRGFHATQMRLPEPSFSTGKGECKIVRTPSSNSAPKGSTWLWQPS